MTSLYNAFAKAEAARELNRELINAPNTVPILKLEDVLAGVREYFAQEDSRLYCILQAQKIVDLPSTVHALIEFPLDDKGNIVDSKKILMTKADEFDHALTVALYKHDGMIILENH